MAQPQNVIVKGQVTFYGSIAGQVGLVAQAVAGTLNLALPNQLPSPGQVLAATSVSGLTAVLGWVSLPSMGGSGTVTSVTGAGIATGSVTTSGSITVAGSGSTTTAVTAAASVATAPANDVITADGLGNAKDSGILVSALALAASLPSTIAPVSHNFLTGYDSGTHTFSAGQPASTDLSDVALLAYLVSPAFSGTPTAPTQTPGTANTTLATTGYSDAAVAALSSVVAHLDESNTFAAGHQQTFNTGANLAFVDPADNTKSMHLDLTSVGTGTDVALGIPASTSWGVVDYTPVAHQFITGIAQGILQAAQPAAADLSDSATSVGNVLRANGTSFVSAPLASTDLSDANLLAYLASPTFTGTVTLPAAVSATSGSDLVITQTGANKVRIATPTGVFDFFGTGDGMSLASQNASITIDVNGAISLTNIGAPSQKINLAPNTVVNISGVPGPYANNAAAVLGGLVIGDVYYTVTDPRTLAVVF